MKGLWRFNLTVIVIVMILCILAVPALAATTGKTSSTDKPTVALTGAGFSSSTIAVGDTVKAYVETTNTGTQKYRIYYKVRYSTDGIKFNGIASSGVLYQTGKSSERLETRLFKVSDKYKTLKVSFWIDTKQAVNVSGNNPVEVEANVIRPTVGLTGAGFSSSTIAVGDTVKAYVETTNTGTQKYRIYYKVRYSTDGIKFNGIASSGVLYQTGKSSERLETRLFKVSDKYKKLNVTFWIDNRQAVNINGENPIEAIVDCSAKTNERTDSTTVDNIKVTFPKDEGIHKDYNTEWWYMNLDLKDRSQNTYRGFVAIMRRNVSGNEKALVYLQAGDVKRGIALSKTIHGTLTASENGLDLIFKGDYEGKELLLKFNTAYSSETRSKYRLTMELPNSREKASFIIENRKRPLYEGEDGIVSIGPNVDSYYYSFTDLNVVLESASLPEYRALGIQPGTIKGKAWFDHQWFNIPSQYNKGDTKLPDEVNHEWFSVQLSNKTQLVFWDLGFPNGLNYKYLGVIDESGKQNDYYGNFEIKPMSYWTSKSGERYANKWNLYMDNGTQETGDDISLIISTQIPDQIVIDGEDKFYEGGTTVEGKYKGQEVNGSGYAEMTRTY